jgi:hypothetical protein
MVGRCSTFALVVLLVGVACAWPHAARAEPEVARCPELGLRLLRPGWRWTLLEREAAAGMLPNALLGATGPDGQSVLVLADAAPGIDLDTFARVQLAGAPPSGRGADAVEHVTYAGRPAARLRIAYATAGVWMDEEDLYFLHAGWLVHIQAKVPRPPRPAWTLGSGPPPPVDLDVAFAPFHEALSIEDPAAPAVLRGAPAVDARGVGWRVRNRVFEHGFAGLRLPFGEAWDALPAAAAAPIDEDAEVVLVHRETGTVLVLVFDADLGLVDQAHRDMVLALVRRVSGARGPGADRTVPFLGEPLAFSTAHLGAPYPRQIACAARRRAPGVLVLRPIVPGHLLERGWEALGTLLGSATSLDEDERRAVADEATSTSDPDDRIDAMACVRAGTWSDFTHGLTWTKPSTSWRVRTTSSQGDILVARDLATGVSGRLQWIPPLVTGALALPPSTPGAWHDGVVARMPFDTPPVRSGLPLRVAGQDALFTSWLPEPAPAAAVVFAVVTVPWRKGCLVGHVVGPAHGGRDVDEAMQAWVEALAAPDEALRAQERTGRRVEDRRLGLSFAVPDSTWLLRDETPAALLPRGGLLHALGPQQDAIVAALFADAGADVARDALVTEIRRNLGALFLSATEMPPLPGRLAGLEATCHAWHLGEARADLWVARAGGVVYALCVTTRPDGGGLTIEELEPALQWVR